MRCNRSGGIPRLKLVRGTGCPAFWLAWLWSCAALSASSPNYITRVWQHDDGLPQNAVSAIVQTQDGYLWIGTYSGLARFDGVRFVVFDNNNTPEMYSSRVTSLYEDDEGSLWIGFETGGLARYHDKKFKALDVPAEWNGRRIIAIGKDAARDLWVLGVDGWLLRLRVRMLYSLGAPGWRCSGPETTTSSCRLRIFCWSSATFF